MRSSFRIVLTEGTIDAPTTEAEQSLDAQREKIAGAWEELAKGNPFASYTWCNEVFADHVIVRMGEDWYSIPFSENTDGDIEFDTGAASKVERTWVAVESELDLRPVESEDGSDPDGSVWEVTIIQAGASKNSRIYPEAVLKAATPLFEGARVLARSDQAHITGQEKSVEKLVGWLQEATYDKGAIRGQFVVTAQWLRDLLLEAWKRGKRDLVGLSIVAEGRGKSVRKGASNFVEVEEITRVSSVDVVFDPAAGGGHFKLVAAIGKEESPVDPKLIAMLVKASPEVIRGILAEASEEDVTAIKEAHPELAEKITEALATPAPPAPTAATPPAPTPATPAAPAPTAPLTEAEDPDLVPALFGRFVITEALGQTKLPEIVQKRIRNQYAGKAFKETELTETIQGAIAEWAELEKAHLVRSAGEDRETRVTVTLEEAEKAKAALDGFFMQSDVEVNGTKVPRYRSIKKAYIELTGDERVSGQLSEASGGRLGINADDFGRFKIRRLVVPELFSDLREAHGDVDLREAVSVATFDQALGDSITRAMLKQYAELNLQTWDALVDTVPVNDFRTNHRIRMGGYNNLPTVAENGPYTALTTPGDEEATYAATKRGGTETISLEAITNDDIGAVRSIPRRLARAAAQTLHEFVFDFLRSNAAIYDSVALFHGTHNNLGSTALSASSLIASWVRMAAQADMSNSKKLGLRPRHLWVPVALAQTAHEILMSEQKPASADNDVNFVRSFGMDFTVVDYWTDSNDWFTSADKSQTPLIEVGFLFGENPELFTQDNPTQGSLFSNDQLKYKIRHTYNGAVMDFRGLDGSVVA